MKSGSEYLSHFQGSWSRRGWSISNSTGADNDASLAGNGTGACLVLSVFRMKSWNRSHSCSLLLALTALGGDLIPSQKSDSPSLRHPEGLLITLLPKKKVDPRIFSVQFLIVRVLASNLVWVSLGPVARTVRSLHLLFFCNEGTPRLPPNILHPKTGRGLINVCLGRYAVNGQNTW